MHHVTEVISYCTVEIFPGGGQEEDLFLLFLPSLKNKADIPVVYTSPFGLWPDLASICSDWLVPVSNSELFWILSLCYGLNDGALDCPLVECVFLVTHWRNRTHTPKQGDVGASGLFHIQFIWKLVAWQKYSQRVIAHLSWEMLGLFMFAWGWFYFII